MAVITLVTDFGDVDYYVAAVKAKILGVNPTQTIVDISHRVAKCDVAHAGYLVKAIFRDFPQGSVHLVAVNSLGQPDDDYIAAELEGHFFVTTDMGLLGLISDQEATGVVKLNSNNETNFPAKDVFAEAAAKLAGGEKISNIGTPLPHFKKMLGRHLKANKSLISGHVLRVDHYGNLITNIDKPTFDIISSKNSHFNITFGRENSRRIHAKSNQVEPGEIFVVFNSLGLLEIGINQGNASALLGLNYDSPVMIKFEE